MGIAMVSIPVKLYNNGISYHAIAIAYLVTVVGFVFRTVFCLPIHKLEDSEDFNLSKSTLAGKFRDSEEKTEEYSLIKEKKTFKKNDDTGDFSWADLLKYIKNTSFLLFLFWYVLADTKLIITFGIFNRFTREFYSQLNPEEAARMAEEAVLRFTQFNFFSMFAAPLSGAFVDLLERNLGIAKGISISVLIFICTCAVILICILERQTGSEAAMLSISVLFPLSRTLCYGRANLFLLEVFPMQMFGSLFGVSNFIAGWSIFVVGKLAHNIALSYLSYAFMILAFISLVLPFYVFRKYQKSLIN